MAGQTIESSEEYVLLKKMVDLTAAGRLPWERAQIPGQLDLAALTATSSMALTANFIYSTAGQKWTRFWVKVEGDEILDLFNPFVNSLAASRSRYGIDNPIYRIVGELFDVASNDRNVQKFRKAMDILDKL